MTALLVVAALTAWTALAFTAGKWHLRWTAYLHTVRAARASITDPTHLADALAWHRRQLPRLLRLHMPHLPVGRRAA